MFANLWIFDILASTTIIMLALAGVEFYRNIRRLSLACDKLPMVLDPLVAGRIFALCVGWLLYVAEQPWAVLLWLSVVIGIPIVWRYVMRDPLYAPLRNN